MRSERISRPWADTFVSVLLMAAGSSLVWGQAHESHAKTGSSAAADTAQATPDVIPSLATLPRLKESWFVPGIADATIDGSPLAKNGVLIAREGRATIVAVDTKTGKERWRARPPKEVFELMVAGEHVVAELADNELASYALATGAFEWSSRELCSGPYRLGLLRLGGEANSAVGKCMLYDSGPQPPLGERGNLEPSTDFLGLALDTGNVRWRRAGFGVKPHFATDGRVVVVATARATGQFLSTLTCLDARTGRETWHRDVEDVVFALGMTAGVVVAVGMKLEVLDARSGKLKWERTLFEHPGETGALPSEIFYEGGFLPRLQNGRLLWPYADKVIGHDLATGKEQRRWRLPRSSAVASNRVAALAVMGKRIVVVMDGLGRSSTTAIFDGDRRSLLAGPSTSLVALASDTLAAEHRGGLAGFSLLAGDVLAAERTLAPVERVQALLDRVPITTAGRIMHPDEVAELQSVPGYAHLVVSIAREGDARQRTAAAALVGQLRLAAGVPVLKAILEQPVPPDPRPGPQSPDEPTWKPKSPAEFPAFRRQWEAARRFRQAPEYERQLEAHDVAEELRQVAKEALARFAQAK